MPKSISAKIAVIRGDITHMEVDAIVNAANTTLLGGGGVDGAIHRAAGPKLLAECKTIGGCPTGEARITKGYNLPARYVIHTVGPVYRHDKAMVAQQLLTNCYNNSLSLAEKHHISSIAFPAISCGVYGYPIRDACRVAVNTTLEFLNTATNVKRVVFVLFSPADQSVYQQYVAARSGSPDG